MIKRFLKIVFYSLLFIGMASILFTPIFYNFVDDTYDWWPLIILLFSVFSGKNMMGHYDPFTGHVYAISIYSSTFFLLFLFIFIFSVIVTAILIIGLIRKNLIIKRIGIIMSFVIVLAILYYFFTAVIHYVIEDNSFNFIFIVLTLPGPIVILASAISLLFIDRKDKQEFIEEGSKERYKQPRQNIENDVSFNNYDNDDDLI